LIFFLIWLGVSDMKMALLASGAHFSARALQRCEEFGQDEGCFGVRVGHALAAVAQHAEVGLLVDGAGDQGHDLGEVLVAALAGRVQLWVAVVLVAEELGVGGGEGGDALFGAVGDEADVGGAGEAEGALGLVEGE
jgi:hypothetical protein